jgi:hypothetical protein
MTVMAAFKGKKLRNHKADKKYTSIKGKRIFITINKSQRGDRYK